MALSDTTSLALMLGITDSSEDSLLSLILSGCDAAIKRWVKRDLEQQSYTEYHSGTGRPELLLRQRPVTTLTSVAVDATGCYGDGTNAFASSTLLTAGQDYVLRRDGPSNRGESGIVEKIGGTPGIAGGMVYPSGVRRGTLSGWDRAAVWPVGTGNIKVVYTAGYNPVPDDLKLACNLLAAQVRAARVAGTMQGENLIDYSYSLLARGQTPELHQVRSLLSQFREPVV